MFEQSLFFSFAYHFQVLAISVDYILLSMSSYQVRVP